MKTSESQHWDILYFTDSNFKILC